MPSLVVAATMVLLWACGKTDVTTAAGSNTKLMVVNVSPDAYPVGIFVNASQVGTSTFKYGIPSSYYSVGSTVQHIQVRNYNYLTTFFTRNDTLYTNCNYTLYVTGYLSTATKADTLTSLLTLDTTALPAIGKAKIRFVNVSVHPPAFDVYANGTLAFSNRGYKSVSSFLQLTAGVYDFQLYTHGNSSSVLTDLPKITLQDGKIYTLFAYGQVSRSDSASLAAKVILNK